MNTTTKKAANSIVGKLTAGILAVVAALLAANAATPLLPSAPAQPGGDAVLVVGDSLELGSGPYLRQGLAGTFVDMDAVKGRTSSGGVAALADELGPEHGTIVFPLGTNDLSAEAFAANLAAVRQLAAGRCIVLATVTRRRVRGVSAAALNEVIARFAAQGGVQVADWRAAALSTPGVLGRDQTHATDQGYALRASLLAEAVQGCLLGGDLGGLPAPKDQNARPPRNRRARGEPKAEAPPARPAPPIRLPAPAALEALGSALARVVSRAAAAGRAARTAALGEELEPVLGSP